MRLPAEQDRENLAAFLLRMRAEGPRTRALMQAVEEVPRRLFLPEEKGDVYADESFPLPCGETAGSVRSAVRMLDALAVQPDSRILEIGTGSGYVTALLAKLGARVTSLDRYRRLVGDAKDRFRTLGLTNGTFVLEDGREGYLPDAPYDRILVHASFDALPRTFLDQLAMHGYVVYPVGPALGEQRLLRQQKVGSRLEAELVASVRLQPLARGVASIL